MTHLVLHGGYKCDTHESFMVATSVTHLVLHGGYKCDTPESFMGGRRKSTHNEFDDNWITKDYRE